MLVPLAPRTEREILRYREEMQRYLEKMKTSLANQAISDPPTQAEVQAIQTALYSLLQKIHT